MQELKQKQQEVDKALAAIKERREKRQDQAGPVQERGRNHIYAGDGKGKTTAATGLAVRAASRGWRVLFIQFLKSGTSAELDVLRSLPNVDVISGQKINKFTFAMTPEELAETRQVMGDRLQLAIDEAKDYDLIVLDEALGAISAQVISEDLVADFMANKPQNLELVVTGRNPSERLVDLADYYSEVCMRKHPYETEGLNARAGVEF
ncbi:MAG: cob(I)yrinic acid a,c-diamide adenosyltransferase [Eubacteriales bacterium]|nr:cob(I)yrinic acid a,c-diamide adenosyltransferase [Eubacteriales bacterium]